MIAWTYLDKKAAVAEALKDYPGMEFIIQNSGDIEKELRESMASLPSAAPAGTPRGQNPKGGEARLAAQIDAIDVLKERYRSALEYMEWFKPAWESLTEDDRFVLTEFYVQNGDSREDSVGNICDRFLIERSSAYNKKNRALARLTNLLYGK